MKIRISVSSWATTDDDVERSLEAMLRATRSAVGTFEHALAVVAAHSVVLRRIPRPFVRALGAHVHGALDIANYCPAGTNNRSDEDL